MIEVRLAPRDDETRQTWYFTFGFLQSNAGNYVVVRDATFSEAREKMFSRFGREWAFQYDENDWHRDGVSQAERYGLKEIVAVKEQPKIQDDPEGWAAIELMKNVPTSHVIESLLMEIRRLKERAE